MNQSDPPAVQALSWQLPPFSPPHTTDPQLLEQTVHIGHPSRSAVQNVVVETFVAIRARNMKSMHLVALACATLLCGAHTTLGKRTLLQTSVSSVGQQLGLDLPPVQDSSNFNVVNAATAGPPGPPPPQAPQPPPPSAKAPTAMSEVVAALAPAPSTAAMVLPTRLPATAPVPQIEAQPPRPVTLPAEVPAPATVLPAVETPVPAPSIEPVVVPQVPVPAPQVLVTLPEAPTPAPFTAPAPAPVPQPPQCGVRPQCKLFIEDMLCCEAGALTNKQYASAYLQCTHPVNFYSQCLNVTGPRNVTVFNSFSSNSVWAVNHHVQADFAASDYTGNVTLDVEGPRTNGTLAADCGLFITPCLLDGELITKVAPVQALSFTTLPTGDFLDAAPLTAEDIDALDSLVYSNPYYPTACQQQAIGNLDADFFASGWATYTSGVQNQCNNTIVVDSVAAAAAAIALAPMASSGSGTVATSSLG